MPKELEDVIKFNQEIIGLKPAEYLNSKQLKWFNGVIKEELEEFNVANGKYVTCVADMQDGLYPKEDALLEIKAEMLDALIDLIYYALGRFYEIGGTSEDFDCIWEAVHRANMNKKRGNKGRGSDDDAIKPEGWQSPEGTYIAFKKCQRNKNQFEMPNRLDSNVVYGPECVKLEQALEKTSTAELKKACDFNKHISLGIELLKQTPGASSINEAIAINKSKPDYKYDNGKPNLAVVFGGFPKALRDVGHIGTFGASKYLPYSWKRVDNLQERYMSALLRHVLEILDKNEFDNETGRHHLGHIAWNAMALLEDKFDNSIEYEAYNEKALATTKATLAKYKELKNEQTNK